MFFLQNFSCPHLTIRAVGIHGVGFYIVVEIQRQDSLDAFLMGTVFDGNHQFHPFVQVAGHPVGRRDEYVFFPVIVEVE